MDISPILSRYPEAETSLIEILHDVQAEHRHVPRQTLAEIAAYTRVPVSRVYGVATFYAAFSFEPKGEKVVKFCLGTACHVKGAANNLEEAEKRLGIKAGETTGDGKYTIEAVNCVGACGIAPVVVVGEEYISKFKLTDLDKILKD